MNTAIKGAIYELIDPRSGVCRYIGKTCNLESRKRAHANWLVSQGNARYARWKHELHLAGLAPSFVVIENGIPLKDLNERERHWVSVRSSEGRDLVNCRIGAIRGEDFLREGEMEFIADTIRRSRDLLFFAYQQSKLPQSHKKMRSLSKAVRVTELAAALFTP